jgi:hypothetical protein
LKKIHRIMLSSIMCTLLAQWLVGDGLYARVSKDVILVLDTSLSMKGYGGKDIFNRVKQSVSQYIDKLEDGDRVTFMTFDTDIRMYPAVLVDDENDRDIIKKYISMTDAKGPWTYTYKMLGEVFKKTDEIQKSGEGRQAVIVVMTDALDDPPPGSRDKRFDIKEIASKYAQKDWWIYFVSFSNLAGDKRLTSMQKSLEKELKTVSKNVKVIDAGSNPEKAIGKDFQRDVREMEEQSSSGTLWIVLAVIAAILLILLIIFLRRKAAEKVRGRIEYWKNNVIDPYTTSFDLTKRPAREVVIGRGIGCNPNIRDFELDMPFKIAAVRDKSGIRMKLVSSPNYPIAYVNRKEGEFLEDGDVFYASNYSFKYFAS